MGEKPLAGCLLGLRCEHVSLCKDLQKMLTLQSKPKKVWTPQPKKLNPSAGEE
jgi:hypothetical protein